MKLNEVLQEATGYMPGVFDYHIELPGKDEVKVVVSYDHTPFMPPSKHGPGNEESVDIYSVTTEDGTDVVDDIKANPEMLDTLEQAALEHEIDVYYDDRY